MSVIKVNYLEKIYVDVDDEYFSSVVKVDEREPLAVNFEANLVGFRYFDVLETVEDDRVIKSDKPTNYSEMYYFGDKLSYQDLLLMGNDDFINKLQLEYLDRNNLNEAIFCKCGVILDSYNDVDKTIDEVKIARVDELKNRIFINQSQFFTGLAELLRECRSDVSFMTSEVQEVVVDDCDLYLCEDEAIIRTYSIYVDKYLSASASGVSSAERLGDIRKDTYFKLEEADNVISALYEEFPSLRIAMKNYKIAICDNDYSANDVVFGTMSNKTK